MAGAVMYLTRSWPRLSQTFIVNEVLALERLGVDLEVFAMTRSGETVTQPQVDEVRAPVRYLDDATTHRRVRDHVRVLLSAPGRYLAAARFARRNPDLSSGYATATTTECFHQAVHIAATYGRRRRTGTPVIHLHAHFAHDPALVAYFVHRMTQVTYSITAHARDLYQIPQRSLAVRTGAARSVQTCCETNATYLHDTLDAHTMAKVRVSHHGVDLRQFVPRSPDEVHHGAPRIVSVGRMVEKKGFPDLLRACAEVARDRAFTLTIYGDGPMRGELEALRDELGLEKTVIFAGEHDSSVIVEAMRTADVFAITPFVTADGDRDGVPNVIVEALASGLPVVSTRVGGVGEAVLHRQNGLLSDSHDVPAISAHLRELIEDAELRQELGLAARATVEERFDVDAAARRLVGVFGVEAVVG